MCQVEDHLVRNVNPYLDALVFTAGADRWRAPCLPGECGSRRRCGRDCPAFTFHGLRHSFLAILVAAGSNVREVSAWAVTTTSRSRWPATAGCSRTDEAVDRLDALLCAVDLASADAVELRRLFSA